MSEENTATEKVNIAVGQVITGTVDGIAGFGAFVRMPDGRKGLVHISEVASAYVENVSDVLHNGDEVKALVLSDDGDRVRLSIKRANGDAGADQRPRKGGRDDARGPRRDRGPRGGGFAKRDNHRGPVSFEDKLARFMKESNERLADLHSNIDAKRGSSSFRGPRRGR